MPTLLESIYLDMFSPNKANALGRQKAPLRFAF